MNKLIIYTDGSSKGNPGPARIGVVICDQKENILKKYSKDIGIATNNEAEYLAVIFALKKVKSLWGKKRAKNTEIEIRSDSELLVSQLNKKYKILEPKIQNLFIQLWNLSLDFKKVKFILIPRELNKIADSLAQNSLFSL